MATKLVRKLLMSYRDLRLSTEEIDVYRSSTGPVMTYTFSGKIT
jgi:hypothetical protein